MAPIQITHLKDLKIESHQIPAHGLTPNTSIQHKPLLVYRSVFPSPKASHIETHFTHTAVVIPEWRYTMYTRSHFHSTTHEVLGIANGAAKLCFGHEANPGKVETIVRAGDVLVVPAGVAHSLVEDLEGGFEMVGCYPKGCEWDMCYGEEGEEERVKGIKGVEWFGRDPVYGDEGPVFGA